MLFLLIGDEMPQVHYLTPAQKASFYQRLELAAGYDPTIQEAIRVTFGIKARYAIPAVPAAMEQIALEIQDDAIAPHSERVRALAAALALDGATYEWPSSQTRVSVYGVDNDEGGDRVTQSPAPVQPAPQDAIVRV